MSTTIYLIRHGNIDCVDCVPGWLSGFSLSEKGKEQARWVAEYLKSRNIRALYCSPLERAIQTAAPLAELYGIPINTLNELIEINFGEWAGHSFHELDKSFEWKQFHFFRNGSIIPGGELMVAVQKRMIAAVNKICKDHGDQAVALISHNDPLKSLLAFCTGISLDLFQRVAVSTGSVSELVVDKSQYFLKTINITKDLALTRI